MRPAPYAALLAAFAASSATAIIVVPHVTVVPHAVAPARPVFARPSPAVPKAQEIIHPPARAAITVPAAAHSARPASAGKGGEKR